MFTKRIAFILGMMLILLPGNAWAKLDIFCLTPDEGGIAVSLVHEKWTIIHSINQKDAFSRDDQFNVRDITVEASEKMQWQGTRNKNPDLRMVGTVLPRGEGQYSYEESLFDDSKGKEPIYRIHVTECTSRSSPPHWPVSGARLSQSIVRFPPYTGYDEARISLKALGYKPAKTSDDLSRCSIGFERRCVQYPEAQGCSGTGMAHCTFLWKSPEGALLEVGTTGEVDPPTVEYVRCRANCQNLTRSEIKRK